MHPSAFSPDGYIIDQRHTKAAKYGVRTSDRNGCGWIAAYNFLRAVGEADDWQQIVKDMRRGSPFLCALGTGPFRLKRYLRRRGYTLTLARGRDAAIKLAEASGAGILFYLHSHGLHFVAFTREADDQFRFFNAVLGDANHVMGMGEFLDKHAKRWPVWVFAKSDEIHDRADTHETEMSMP